MRALVVLVLLAGVAHAERYVVERGEALEAVAARRGGSTDALLRANHLDTTLVPAGTVVTIPRCAVRARARTHAARSAADAPPSAEDKARAALAAIDGTSFTDTAADDDPPPATDDAAPAPHHGDRESPGYASLRSASGTRTSDPFLAPLPPSRSLGVPWRGALVDAVHLPRGDGYLIRRPSRAYGASYVIDHLRGAIAEVRALYPGLPTLAIGDISAEHGGPLASHLSHQSGLDADVGFYFTRTPRGYPAHFAPASADLNFEATWALLVAFARTAHLRDGVQMIFLDYGVQHRLYDWAKAHGTPDDELRFMFQYPRGKDAMVGLVRHWPGHTDHFHVRFKDAR